MNELVEKCRLTDEEINKTFEGAFDKPVDFDHKPTMDEILTLRLKAVEQALLAKAIPLVSAEARKQERERIKTAPVVCLCGSTRFTREMLIKQWELTKQGFIVVSWCALPDDYFQGEDKTHIGDQEGVKELVDEIHKRKIDLCDEVFALNIDGYIGESTASEIAYAVKIGKPITYWQALKP